MRELVIIERSKLKLATRNGYFSRFFELCPEMPTYKRAYLQTEREYREIFEKKRYLNYASFRRAKSQFLKKKASFE